MTFEQKIKKTITKFALPEFNANLEEIEILNFLDYYISCLKGTYENQKIFNKNGHLDKFEYLSSPSVALRAFCNEILHLIVIKRNRTPYNILSKIKDLLISKNKRYGNAALEPIRIFAQADNVEQIKVRIDDKLNRIKQGHVDDDEDVLMDLLGYLILLDICTDCL